MQSINEKHSQNGFQKLVKEELNEESKENYSIINELKESHNLDDQSLGRILGYINENKDKYLDSIEKSIYVLGNTGSGKTAFSAFLSGLKLVVKADKHKDLYYDYEDSKNESRLIGVNDFESQTLFPNKFECPDGSVLWDCPGFLDSRGDEIQIMQFYHINSISKKSKLMKFILVIDSTTLNTKGFGTDKGESFKQLFEVLQIMINGQNIDLSKSLSIVFTKSTKDIEYYKEKMYDIYDNLLEAKGFSDKIKIFFKQHDFTSLFKDLKKAQYLVFPAPNKLMKQTIFK